MNEITRPPFVRPTTQGAEGLPRWRWTLAEFDKMIESGLLSEDDRVELIEGELVPMAAKGNRHELVKTELINRMFRRLADDEILTVELGWRPNSELYLEPDVVIYQRGPQPSEVPAPSALLVVEISDSSLRYDLERKAMIYASLGVREYLVVDANTLETTVHLSPSAEGYRSVGAHAPTSTLTPTLIPALALSLGGLAIG